MASFIHFQNQMTGQIKDIKVGWSWTLFLFSAYGIPLFIRGLHVWGIIMITMSCLMIMSNTLFGPSGNFIHFLFLVALLIMSIFLALKGNDYGAKYLLENGWVIIESHSLGKNSTNVPLFDLITSSAETMSDDNDPKLLCALALFDRIGNNFERALARYQKAAKLDLNYFEAWYGIACTYFMMGKYEEAIPLYDRAFQLDAQKLGVLYDKGEALENLGRYEEAIASYDKIITLDSTKLQDLITQIQRGERLKNYRGKIRLGGKDIRP